MVKSRYHTFMKKFVNVFLIFIIFCAVGAGVYVNERQKNAIDQTKLPLKIDCTILKTISKQVEASAILLHSILEEGSEDGLSNQHKHSSTSTDAPGSKLFDRRHFSTCIFI